MADNIFIEVPGDGEKVAALCAGSDDKISNFEHFDIFDCGLHIDIFKFGMGDSFVLCFRFVDILLFNFYLREGLFCEIEVLTVIFAEVDVGVNLFEDGGETEFMAVVVFVF
jgi:hypothetical protein